MISNVPYMTLNALYGKKRNTNSKWPADPADNADLEQIDKELPL
jgi:hypothetical protein